MLSSPYPPYPPAGSGAPATTPPGVLTLPPVEPAISTPVPPASIERLRTLAAAGRLPEAATLAAELLGHHPEWGDGWVVLAQLQEALGDPPGAIRSLLQALALSPEDREAAIRLGALLREGGRYGLAARVSLHALAHHPGDLPLTLGLADALEKSGRLVEAREVLAPLTRGAEGTHGMVGVVWATVLGRLGEAAAALPLLERLAAAEHPPVVTAMLHHRLGVLYDQLDRPGDAFAAWSASNAALPGDFDPAALIAETDALIAATSPEALPRLPRAADHSEMPVLIVGMPRSGTSLVERVLGSHPEVRPAGELDDLDIAARQLGGWPLHRPDPAQVTALGAAYLAARRKHAAGCRFVIDKMPANFRNLGLAAMLLPGARVIHCVRDPWDVALSCFEQPFRQGLAWSRRLEHIGLYHQQYRRLMAHWEATPPLPLRRVSYEALVADPEGQTRQLLAFLGLTWHPACGDAHASRRRTLTASYAQVEQPITARRVGRARRYRAHLAPLEPWLEPKARP